MKLIFLGLFTKADSQCGGSRKEWPLPLHCHHHHRRRCCGHCRRQPRRYRLRILPALWLPSLLLDNVVSDAALWWSVLAASGGAQSAAPFLPLYGTAAATLRLRPPPLRMLSQLRLQRRFQTERVSMVPPPPRLCICISSLSLLAICQLLLAGHACHTFSPEA